MAMRPGGTEWPHLHYIALGYGSPLVHILLANLSHPSCSASVLFVQRV